MLFHLFLRIGKADALNLKLNHFAHLILKTVDFRNDYIFIIENITNEEWTFKKITERCNRVLTTAQNTIISKKLCSTFNTWYSFNLGCIQWKLNWTISLRIAFKFKTYNLQQVQQFVLFFMWPCKLFSRCIRMRIVRNGGAIDFELIFLERKKVFLLFFRL